MSGRGAPLGSGISAIHLPKSAKREGLNQKTDCDIANSDHPIIEFHRMPKNQANFNELL